MIATPQHKPPELVAASTAHARRGAIANTFRYSVDFVLIDPEARGGPLLFSRNARNLAGVNDRDHGGPIGRGSGSSWARAVFADHGWPITAGRTLLLLTQPAILGRVFNPVSFWLAMEGGDLHAVIAEVSTPFDDRHSYLVHLPGFAPITPGDRLTAQKCLHVSPFQDVAGDYAFHFRIAPSGRRSADQTSARLVSGRRSP